MKIPQVLISDFHIGTTLWQLAVMQMLGIEAFSVTHSSHTGYAGRMKEFFRTYDCIKNISSLSPNDIAVRFDSEPELQRLDLAICSFPPSHVFQLLKLPSRVKLLLNIGHRIHIKVPSDKMIFLTEAFKKLALLERLSLAAMSEYDFHYLRYYTGIEVRKMPVIGAHIPRVIRERGYHSKSKVILIGPAHNTQNLGGLGNIADLNRLSADYASSKGIEAFQFDFIKSIYKDNDASPENICNHPACVIFPYSSFSISMIEVYQMNIPCFFPCNELLLDRLEDVRLAPLYHDEGQVMTMEKEYLTSGKLHGYPYSPNDSSHDAQQFWMKFMYFNTVKNAIRFRSFYDLIGLVYNTNFSDVSRRMTFENRQLFDCELSNWSDFISSTV